MKKERCALILCAVGAQAGFIKEGMEAKESGDHKKLVEVYDKACNEGKASGCYNLAVLYSEGTGNVAKDSAKAVKLYEKACSADFATACYNLGLIYADGIVVKQDFAKAKELYEKSCAGDEGCTNLGLL